MSSDCCSVSEISQKDTVLCPRCGEKGKPVSLATVGAMAKTEVEAVKLSAEEYKLCRNRDCPVVYYAGEVRLEKSALRVLVNFKEHNYEGPVCYCFNHTIASIRAEVQTKGHSTAQGMITQEVKAGRCACEVKNPVGTCCLGDVTREVQAVMAQLKETRGALRLPPLTHQPSVEVNQSKSEPREQLNCRIGGLKMLTNQRYSIASLLLFAVCLVPNAARAQEGADKLIVHIRSAAVTLNHVALKNEGFGKEVAASLQKIAGVSQTRALPISGIVEARFDTNKTTGEQVANAGKQILEEKLEGRKIEAQNLSSHKASSKILVKSVSGNQVQITSERFYWISCGTRGVSDIKQVNGVIDAEINGPAATIPVTFDPSKTDANAIAVAAKTSLDSDHAHMMSGGQMTEVEYVKWVASVAEARVFLMAKRFKGIKDVFLLVTGFVTCPCHLPFLLRALAALLAGTAVGAFILENTGLLVALTTAYFVGAVVYFLRGNTSNWREQSWESP